VLKLISFCLNVSFFWKMLLSEFLKKFLQQKENRLANSHMRETETITSSFEPF